MARTLAFAAMLTTLLAHVACTLHVVVVPERVTDVLYTAIELGAVALVAARVIAVRRNRAGWALIALGIAMWSAGDLCWTLWLNALETAPYPPPRTSAALLADSSDNGNARANAPSRRTCCAAHCGSHCEIVSCRLRRNDKPYGLISPSLTARATTSPWWRNQACALPR